MKITLETTVAPENQHPRSTLSPLPPSDLSHKLTFPRKHPHRKSRPPGARFRGNRESSRCIRPETPLLQWKFDESNDQSNSVEEEGKLSSEVDRNIGRAVRPVVSARKLGAGLRRLHLPQFPTDGRKKLGLQSRGSHLWSPTQSHQVGNIHSFPENTMGHGPHYMPARRNVHQPKVEPSFQYSNSVMEGSTKWDPVHGKKSGQFNHISGQTKLLNQQALDAPVIPTLEKELEQARARINQLETERKSSKKKLEQFLQKVSEERAAWKSREHEKVRAIIVDMKAELSREKKNRQRLEIVNSKLVNELADAKLSAKCYLQEYEKERKSRELMEDVCDELAQEIEGDNAEVETMKKESQKLCEEVEEERKMLQMAEVWREERVQMKLVDAKVMLEEKYTLMSRIITGLEAFLNSKTTSLDLEEMKKIEFLKEMAASVNMQDVRKLKYEPPNPDDMFSMFEDINFGESNEREVEPCNVYSPASQDSRIHTVNPEVKLLHRDTNDPHSHVYTDQSGELEKDSSEWETVTHPEDQGSSYSPSGSDSFQVRNISREWGRSGGVETKLMDGVVGLEQPPKIKKASYISRLWRSQPSDGDDYKIISVEGVTRELSDGRLSNGAIVSPDFAGQWGPHKTRGMKGCVEWPHCAQKSSLKPQLSGERIESQKVQLRQVLKEKI